MKTVRQFCVLQDTATAMNRNLSQPRKSILFEAEFDKKIVLADTPQKQYQPGNKEAGTSHSNTG
jgi:hypothetical protein